MSSPSTDPIDDPSHLVDLLEAVGDHVVGRRRETELVVAALAAGRHVLLEGPPGTGKSTVLRAVADATSTDLVFVEGNAELTPARLAGQFDPARVLSEGYVADAFVAGPLVAALRSGSLLYVEELNRVPEETINLLITVMSEGELHLPRVGRVDATTGFMLVAAMNPFDNVGTARVSGAIYDRICRIAMSYQSAADERAIVERRTGVAGEALLTRRAVAVTRATRADPDVRFGSSVRGAIDLVEVAGRLAPLRSVDPDDPDVGLDAALVALTGRIRTHEGGDHNAEDVVQRLWAAVLSGRLDDEDHESASSRGGREGKAGAPVGATARRA